jgi:large subunit ribosomal protein L9
MQVILKQNVPRVGRYLDIVEVSNGYANNFLFPQKLAEPATEAKIALLEKRREANKAKEVAELTTLTEKFAGLETTPVTLTVKSDDQGNLYKKIHASDIAQALKTDFDITIPETAILLDSPIDKVGEHSVTVEFGELKANLITQVVREAR